MLVILPVSPVAAATIPFSCELRIEARKACAGELNRAVDNQGLERADDGQVCRQSAALQHGSFRQLDTHGRKKRLQTRRSGDSLPASFMFTLCAPRLHAIGAIQVHPPACRSGQKRPEAGRYCRSGCV